MDQHELILNYLEEHGSISPMEAFMHFGITKLSTRISEMRRKGIEFSKEWETSKNRYGRPVTYMRYRKVS